MILTKRQEEVVKLVCKGMTNKEIADALCVGIKCVKAHLYNVFRKYGIKRRTELIYKRGRNEYFESRPESCVHCGCNAVGRKH